MLSCLDGYMNIALEQTEEYVNGVRTNTYGDAFVRGNNGKLISHRHARACSVLLAHSSVARLPRLAAVLYITKSS